MSGSLSLRRVRKSFGAVDVIRDVSFDIRDGGFTVFVGPSGCGKSTLLRMICGLETVSAGEIAIGGDVVNHVPAARRGLAMVFQSYALYPHMTVFQNMAFGLENIATPKPEIERRVAEAARMLKLDTYLQRKPTALSGGQRQRVAIGRAIVREPRIFLFDEPLSNLDAELRVGMRAELTDLHRRLGTTMVYVTHDQTEAMTMADTIVVLRAGHVEQVGAPLELYNNPCNLFVAGFIGSPRMNFLDGVSVGQGAVEVSGIGRFETLATELPAGGRATIGIRPEHIRLDDTIGGRVSDAGGNRVSDAGGNRVSDAGGNRVSDAGGNRVSDAGGNHVSGTVAGVEQLGGLSYLRLASPDVTVQIAGQTGLGYGDAVSVHLPPAAIHVFDADGLAVGRRSP